MRASAAADQRSLVQSPPTAPSHPVPPGQHLFQAHIRQLPTAYRPPASKRILDSLQTPPATSQARLPAPVAPPYCPLQPSRALLLPRQPVKADRVWPHDGAHVPRWLGPIGQSHPLLRRSISFAAGETLLQLFETE